jgi:hypothetical protein
MAPHVEGADYVSHGTFPNSPDGTAITYEDHYSFPGTAWTAAGRSTLPSRGPSRRPLIGHDPCPAQRSDRWGTTSFSVSPPICPGLLASSSRVLRTLVHEGESVDGVCLAWEGDPPSRGRSDLLLTLVVEGDTFRWVAITQDALPEGEADARRRLASDLQDFVAESTFARGQLRPHSF